MSEPPLPEESIFAQALEITSADERAAFLDRVCGDNPALRAEVEALLRAHERSGDLLDLPENLPTTADLPAREGPGSLLGPYKLLRVGIEPGTIVYNHLNQPRELVKGSGQTSRRCKRCS